MSISDGSLTLPHICLDYYALDSNARTMVLQVHLTILSDLTPEQEFESDNGIIPAVL